ncbi:glutamic acid-rich protein-like [Drosophila guanche]|uniref:Uncharacterized protein n=1 Tax=Drosophila guanche TaxID=7266 RepID=A0A3B0JS75_DROGU|nr:glutamic acid-rich protein-like [Drosophila guanche]SPP78310.1 Hypothetical predicted protein [Drosophila guanche]
MSRISNQDERTKSLDKKTPDQGTKKQVEEVVGDRFGQEGPLDYDDTSVEELVEKWKQLSEERDCQFASIGLQSEKIFAELSCISQQIKQIQLSSDEQDVLDNQANDDEAVENQANDDEALAIEAVDNQAADDQVVDNQEDDNQVDDDQADTDQAVDNQAADDQVVDNQEDENQADDDQAVAAELVEINQDHGDEENQANEAKDDTDQFYSQFDADQLFAYEGDSHQDDADRGDASVAPS